MDKDKIKKYFDDALDTGIQIYKTNVRDSIAHSVEGYFFDNLVTLLSTDLREKRFKEAIVTLREELLLIEESKVDKQYLQTDEFFDLILKFFENSVRTRHRDRILLNCKILAGSILEENKDLRHSSEDLLVLVSELSPTDIKVAREIYKQQKDKPEKFDMEIEGNNEMAFIGSRGWDNLQKICELNYFDFLHSLHKLSNANLVKEIVGSYVGYNGHKYIITSTFQRLMSILSYSAEPLFNYSLK